MVTEEQALALFKETGFAEPRANQVMIIKKALDAFESGKKKYVIIQAPTGIGKSIISYSISKYYSTSYFLTHQKLLQKQYADDFKMPCISGSQNYECNKIPACSCKQCLRTSLGKARCADCPYEKARTNAFSNRCCSLNYSYIFSLSGGLRSEFEKYSRDLIICDEAHNLSKELIARGTIHIIAPIYYKICKSLFSKNFLALPDFTEMTCDSILKFVVSDYLEFISRCINDIDLKLKEYHKNNNLIKSNFKKFRILLNARIYFKQHQCQIEDLRDFALKSLDDVVMTASKSSLEIKPLSPNGLFNALIGRYGKKFLFMSATLLNKEDFCRDLDLKPDECEYISLDAVFPEKNRMIYYWPVGSLSYSEKKKTYPNLASRINLILEKYKDSKGIIHTSNYEIEKMLEKTLANSNFYGKLLFIYPFNREDMIEKFKSSSFPYVLVSPSLSEGIDLKDDLSRFCIICKVPYMSLADEWVKRKIKHDPGWYETKTAEILVQQTGRSVRSMVDHADTYILDSDFRNFAASNQEILPRWWLKSIQEINHI